MYEALFIPLLYIRNFLKQIHVLQDPIEVPIEVPIEDSSCVTSGLNTPILHTYFSNFNEKANKQKSKHFT